MLALIFLIRSRRRRRRLRETAEEVVAPQFASHTPLISQLGTTDSHLARYPSRSSQTSRLYSPYSDSDHSHMPILSADGHLLPVSHLPDPAFGANADNRPLPPLPSSQHLVGLYKEQDIKYDAACIDHRYSATSHTRYGEHAAIV